MNTIRSTSPFGTHVRIISRGAAPPSCDLVVQCKTDIGPWVDVFTRNDMSDDYALTETTSMAISMNKRSQAMDTSKEGWWNNYVA